MTAITNQKQELRDQCFVAWMALYESRNAEARQDMTRMVLDMAAESYNLKQLQEWMEIIQRTRVIEGITSTLHPVPVFVVKALLRVRCADEWMEVYAVRRDEFRKDMLRGVIYAAGGFYTRPKLQAWLAMLRETLALEQADKAAEPVPISPS